MGVMGCGAAWRSGGGGTDGVATLDEVELALMH